ncbi:MAG: hypothetical protein WA052_03515 [Microgenomates group bacterium]
MRIEKDINARTLTEERKRACIACNLLQQAQHQIRLQLKQAIIDQDAEKITSLRRQLKNNRRGYTGLRHLNKVLLRLRRYI